MNKTLCNRAEVFQRRKKHTNFDTLAKQVVIVSFLCSFTLRKQIINYTFDTIVSNLNECSTKNSFAIKF